MPAVSDHIERFIKEMMDQCDAVSLQRNELAQHFACAPSQINYVLSTRFTLDHGYMTISRRGSGGYIRVVRMDCERGNILYDMACNRIGNELSKSEANAMIERLQGEKLIRAREAALMKAAVNDCTMPTPQMENGLRARILRAMLKALLQHEQEEGKYAL